DGTAPAAPIPQSTASEPPPQARAGGTGFSNFPEAPLSLPAELSPSNPGEPPSASVTGESPPDSRQAGAFGGGESVSNGGSSPPAEGSNPPSRLPPKSLPPF